MCLLQAEEAPPVYVVLSGPSGISPTQMGTLCVGTICEVEDLG